jgi:hypothetical protein
MLKPCANSSVAPFSKSPLSSVVQGLLRHVGHQHRHQLRALDGRLGLHDLQAVLLGLVPAVALAHADHDVEAAVVQIERMRAALAAVAETAMRAPRSAFLSTSFCEYKRMQVSCNLESQTAKMQDPACEAFAA